MFALIVEPGVTYFIKNSSKKINETKLVFDHTHCIIGLVYKWADSEIDKYDNSIKPAFCKLYSSELVIKYEIMPQE